MQNNSPRRIHRGLCTYEVMRETKCGIMKYWEQMYIIC